MPVALVLSGGGARGNFQLGAVRYLYERGLRPDVICGCSVGAINGAKLAESAEPMQSLQALEAIWLRLRQNSDMWDEEPWFTEVTNLDLRAWMLSKLFTASILPPIGLFVAAHQADREVEEFSLRIKAAKSLFNLGPIGRLFANTANFDPDRVRRSGIKLRIAIVGLESGKLRYVTEAGEVLERKQDTHIMGPVLALAEPCQRIADEIDRLQAELMVPTDVFDAEPLPKLRRAESAELEIVKKKRELEQCIAQHHGGRLTIPLRQGILASASIPVAFPPVRLARESYVDGGVREVLPVEAAMDAGADEIVAVAASTMGVPPATSLDDQPLSSFAAATLLDITKRVAQEIMPDETLLNDAYPQGGWGANVTVIQPSLFPDIHDVMTIDPGLIRIQMAHGYMRADDVMQARARAASELADQPSVYLALADEHSETRKTNQIIRARKAIWDYEHRVHEVRHTSRKGAAYVERKRYEARLEEVREMKRELRRLIDARGGLGGALPADAERWWQEWERHPWATRGRGPWEDRAAVFVHQSVPERMVAGRRYPVSVRMKNTGLNTWTSGGANPYRLGSQNPQDNRTWSLGRVEMPTPLPLDAEVVFRFTVTAPTAPGRYNFRWRMVQEMVAWFGDLTPNVSVQVGPPQLQVTVQPYPVPLNVSTQAVVAAVDSETRAPVAGQVLIDGQVVGNTHTPFTYVFRMRLAPDPGGTFPRTTEGEAREPLFSEPSLNTVAPAGMVRASGYPDTPLDFGLVL